MQLLQKTMMMRMMVLYHPHFHTTMYKVKGVDDVVKRVKCERSMAFLCWNQQIVWMRIKSIIALVACMLSAMT